jgi:hypothetical protein
MIKLINLIVMRSDAITGDWMQKLLAVLAQHVEELAEVLV